MSSAKAPVNRRREHVAAVKEIEEEVHFLLKAIRQLGVAEGQGKKETVLEFPKGTYLQISNHDIVGRRQELDEKFKSIKTSPFPAKKPKKAKALFSITNFDTPIVLRPEMHEFLKGANLGKIRIGTKEVALASQLSSLETGIVSGNLLATLLRHYSHVNGLHALATSNKAGGEGTKNNVLGADAHMKKTLGPIFKHIRDTDTDEMKAEGRNEGDLRDPSRKPGYQNEWHAFDPDNFLLFQIARIVKYSTFAEEDVPAAKRALLHKISPDHSKKYTDRVNAALATNPTDFGIYERSLKEAGVPAEVSKLRAAIDRDYAMVKSLKVPGSTDTSTATSTASTEPSLVPEQKAAPKPSGSRTRKQ